MCVCVRVCVLSMSDHVPSPSPPSPSPPLPSVSLRAAHSISPSQGDHSQPPGAGEPTTISSVVVFDQNTFEGMLKLVWCEVSLCSH